MPIFDNFFWGNQNSQNNNDIQLSNSQIEFKEKLEICPIPEQESIITKTILNIKIGKNDLSDYDFIDGLEKIFREIYSSKEENHSFKSLNGEESFFLKKSKDVSGILLEIDSNGGSMNSLILAENINELKEKFDIKVVSFIKNAFSAGYMIPSICSDEIFITKSIGSVGAVGCYIEELNFSEIFKKIGINNHFYSSEGTSQIKYHNPNLPITEEVNSSLNKVCTDIMNEYYKNLKESSGVDVLYNDKLNVTDEYKENMKLFKEGNFLNPEAALNLGLIDQIGSYQNALESLKTKIPNEDQKINFEIINIENKDLKQTYNNGILNYRGDFSINEDSLKNLIVNNAINSYLTSYFNTLYSKQ
jgi:ClpP class serine protease